MSELKRTQLYETHVAAGASMVDFGGWEMPVQYPTGIVAVSDGDWRLFGYMHIYEWEWGYVLLSELQNIELPYGLGIERDLYLADDATVRYCILN